MGKKKKDKYYNDVKNILHQSANSQQDEDENNNKKIGDEDKEEKKRKIILRRRKQEKNLEDDIKYKNKEMDTGDFWNEENDDNNDEQCFENEKRTFLINPKERMNLANTEIAEYILSEKDIVCINRKLYLYELKLGYYKRIEDFDLRIMIYNMIHDQCGIFIKNSDIKEICEFIKINYNIQVKNDKLDKNIMRINCKNGVIKLDKNESKVISHQPQYYFLNAVNAKFKYDFSYSNFKESKFYRFLDTITNGDKQLKDLLQEITGYSLSNLNNSKKFFIFYGKSNSGKSVYLELLTFLCSEENVSSVPLQNLNDERYVGELFGKTLNIYNELPDKGIMDTGTIKSLVSDCDKTICKPLYEKPFSFRNKATLIFATNNLPRIESKLGQDNEAFFNRIIIIPFLNSISEEKQDKDLIKKLKKESDIIFTWAIHGLQRYVENDFRFSECYESQKYLEEYKGKESIIQRFIEERLIFDENMYVYQSDLIEDFKKFYKQECKSSISSKDKKTLKNILIDKFDLEYTKIHRGKENKHGFYGITIKKDF